MDITNPEVAAMVRALLNARGVEMLKKQASPNAHRAGFYGATNDMFDAEHISQNVAPALRSGLLPPIPVK